MVYKNLRDQTIIKKNDQGETNLKPIPGQCFLELKNKCFNFSIKIKQKLNFTNQRMVLIFMNKLKIARRIVGTK